MMNVTLSKAAPSFQAMTPEFIEQLAKLCPIKAALADGPKAGALKKRNHEP
jgi:hypothetical protein